MRQLGTCFVFCALMISAPTLQAFTPELLPDGDYFTSRANGIVMQVQLPGQMIHIAGSAQEQEGGPRIPLQWSLFENQWYPTQLDVEGYGEGEALSIDNSEETVLAAGWVGKSPLPALWKDLGPVEFLPLPPGATGGAVHHITSGPPFIPPFAPRAILCGGYVLIDGLRRAALWFKLWEEKQFQVEVVHPKELEESWINGVRRAQNRTHVAVGTGIYKTLNKAYAWYGFPSSYTVEPIDMPDFATITSDAYQEHDFCVAGSGIPTTGAQFLHALHPGFNEFGGGWHLFTNLTPQRPPGEALGIAYFEWAVNELLSGYQYDQTEQLIEARAWWVDYVTGMLRETVNLHVSVRDSFLMSEARKATFDTISLLNIEAYIAGNVYDELLIEHAVVWKRNI